ILMFYALAGCVAVLFRRLPAASLAVVSIAFLLLGALGETDFFWSGGDPVNGPAHFAALWLPPAAELAAEVELFRSGWCEQVLQRVDLILSYVSHGVFAPLFLLV